MLLCHRRHIIQLIGLLRLPYGLRLLRHILLDRYILCGHLLRDIILRWDILRRSILCRCGYFRAADITEFCVVSKLVSTASAKHMSFLQS